MARIPKLDSAGKFLAADVNAQIDARTKATMRADLPALAEELKIGGGGVEGSVPIFATLAEAQAWEAKNPGKKAFYVADPVTGEDTSGVVPDSDTTGPTGATVAVSGVSASGYTVTVSGAVDVETGLHATAPYAFSKDGGATWTAWQASPSYSVTGLEASTTYPAPKVKVRNQSSTPDESVFTAPAGVTTKSGVTFQAAVADPPATFAWNMDEATGATAFAQTGTDTTAGALPVRSGVTAGARAGLAGYSKAPDITAGSGMIAPIKKASIDGVKGLTLMAVAQIDGGTAYGAEMIPFGFAALSFTAFNKITGWVNIGEYANAGRFTVTADLPQFTSWSAVSAAGTHVVHLRWSVNPDELSIWHQGKKVGSTTYATAVTGAGKTWPNVTFYTGDSHLSVGGSFDGAINGVRAWTNQALTDAEILQHAQSAGVA